MSRREGSLRNGSTWFQAWDAPDPVGDVVIAHGFAEHSGRYAHVAEALVAAGFTTWALDHRGHGRSAGTRSDIESWDAVVSDLDLLIDEVVAAGGGRPVFLVGHSMGGAISLAYALEHQERLTGLSLSAPAIVIAPELLALAELEEIPALPLADGVSTDPAVVQDYKDDPLNHLGPPTHNLLRQFGLLDKVVLARLPEITLPLQVMQGSGDLLISPQALREVVAGVSSNDLTAHLWPGLFHEIFNEPSKADVIAELVDWISRRAA